MWAVIEFAKKECSVVPYSWLIDENVCYWPNKITRQADLEHLVIQKKDPSPLWAKYDIVKVHHLDGIHIYLHRDNQFVNKNIFYR